jgi:hypothetical protein
MLGLAFFLPLTTQGQQWTDEEMEVWNTVEANWEKWVAEDLQGALADFHPELLSWGEGNPLPYDRATVERRNRFSMEREQTLFWEIQPAGIRIIDNVAVVYYFYRSVFLDVEQKSQTFRARYADILMKSDDRWVWVGWYQQEIRSP